MHSYVQSYCPLPYALYPFHMPLPYPLPYALYPFFALLPNVQIVQYVITLKPQNQLAWKFFSNVALAKFSPTNIAKNWNKNPNNTTLPAFHFVSEDFCRLRYYAYNRVAGPTGVSKQRKRDLAIIEWK